MTEKIQKVLSHFGYGSRRSIEKMIKSGSVLINNKKAIIGQRLDEKNFDEIRINNQIVSIKKVKFKTRVLIYNKPEGEICTKKNLEKRTTVFDKLPSLDIYRWISVGRLDINTQGLLLFTNDGNLANKLMHPKNQIEREYYMRIFGKINKNTMNILKNGVRIRNTHVAFKTIHSFKNAKSGQNKWFKGILCEGKNREIRYMWQAVKCQVSRLIRIRYGNIILPKDLKIGHWTELNSILLNDLYNLISM